MRDKILIVDDEELNRELLKQIFEEDYGILEAGNGREAIEIITRCKGELATVLLDLVMPEVDGYQVLSALCAGGETQVIPIIMITANTDTKTALDCYELGAAEIINKPFVATIVKRRVLNMIEMFSSRERLRHKLKLSEQKVTERDLQLEKFNDNFVDVISDVVEFRDEESGQHVKRVKGFTQIMAMTYANLYPEANLTQQKIDMIVKAAALHDIGKIVIPDSILLKPGRLTDEEMAIMKTHTTKGCSVLAKLESVQDEVHYKVAYEIVRHHHERYDGRGYPDGLKGDEIPLSAQLVSVADVYDALTSERVYKKAYDKEKAYRLITENQCGVFDPKLMECFKQSRQAMELYAESMSEKEI